jgi:hypothetical protein
VDRVRIQAVLKANPGGTELDFNNDKYNRITEQSINRIKRDLSIDNIVVALKLISFLVQADHPSSYFY